MERVSQLRPTDHPDDEQVADREAPLIVLPAASGAPEPSFKHPALGDPSQRWTYRDAAGEVIGHVLRFDPPNDRKQFAPLTLWRENGRLCWRWKSWPKPRPLYGLDRLAARPNASVIVVEGEKAADAAQLIFPASVAVTSSGGAEAAGTADWRPLTGRPVMICRMLTPQASGTPSAWSLNWPRSVPAPSPSWML